ncbi:MAG: hypothetical protein HFG26_04330 [Provencibacterium sp.]|jgi:hypothetical protein|nr:hypothetical protein [Provencibacterium sp.]
MKIAASQAESRALWQRKEQLEKEIQKKRASEKQTEDASAAVPLKKLMEDAAQKEKETVRKMAEGIKGQGNAQKTGLAMAQASSNGGGKVKASAPDDSIGQLASELANARSKLDVSTVSGKAMRAMASLRMSLSFAEGKEKEAIRKMITRMEKLMKRIRAKMKHLTKEEQIERQRAKAEKEQETKKARNLENDLRSRRSKRRRDEHNYARRELTEDWKQSQSGGVSPVPAASAPAAPAAPVPVAAEAAAPVDVSAAPAADGALLNLHI